MCCIKSKLTESYRVNLFLYDNNPIIKKNCVCCEVILSNFIVNVILSWRDCIWRKIKCDFFLSEK